MTRILSYNILLGGNHRVEQLTKIILAREPDIVGLIEAIDEEVVKELASQLHMEYRLSGQAQNKEGLQTALLTRLPIVKTKIYANEILQIQPLLEVTVEDTDGQYLTIFVTHLTADFGRGSAAHHTRRGQIQEILRIMANTQENHQLLLGDFNSLAPGERLKGSSFLQYVIQPELYDQLQPDENVCRPDLDVVVPPSLRFLQPLLKITPKSKLLSFLLDRFDFLYAPQGGIDLLQKAGYVDCFRTSNPYKSGFTWPAPLPAGRIDFIFADEKLAGHLKDCDVIVAGEGMQADKASDHLPVFADFSTEARGHYYQEKVTILSVRE